MHIAYYISSHGYGHGVRSSAVCNCFSPQVKLTIRTDLPKRFFDEELARPFAYLPGRFDCGCVQSDGITVDIWETLQTYKAVADENDRILDKEAAWCRENGVTGIVSDIASFPFAVAAQARIPSVGVSNFCWHDIYTPYLACDPAFAPYLDIMCEQYSHAGMVLALSPANTMSCFKNKCETPLVARIGTRRQEEVRTRYHIPAEKKIGLIYAGNFGFDTVQWDRLELFDAWEFLGVYPLPGAPKKFTQIEKKDFSYQDLAASVDCVISKIGYGVFSECLSNGVPLIYVPRTDFAEHPVLENAIQTWGHGYRCSRDDFYSLRWRRLLADIANRVPPARIAAPGALVCARAIEEFVVSATNI